MSNFKKITRHPLDGDYGMAEWLDDYFGPHLYGVRFDWDDVVYPAAQVGNSQLNEFWVNDVMKAFRSFMPYKNEKLKWDAVDDALIAFLAKVNQEYKARWKRDPKGGEGAVEHYNGGNVGTEQ